ncbi:MAG: maleylpyruvate isomerase N-terminal domain-containing protein, partial [Acidimicrobiia bacterium]|nr:maleylpyruvate isomerase N-terminal domain-containing protein [Acidimicrobiia bacterium]
MTLDAIEGLKANLADLEAVLDSMTDDEWRLPSAADGWRVQEVVAHTASSFRTIAGVPAAAPAGGEEVGAEEMAERLIVEQRSWEPARVYDEYKQYKEPFLVGLAAMQEEPLASTEAPLADLGTHQLHILANAFAFDAYCHLHHDVLAPVGPIVRELAEPTELQLRPGIDWMLAGLPQMCPELTGAVTAEIQLDLTGPGGGTWTISPAGDAPFVTITEGPSGSAAATVVS